MKLFMKKVVLQVGVRNKEEGRRYFSVVYVPPEMCSWAADE